MTRTQKVSTKQIESTVKDYMKAYYAEAGIKDPKPRQKGRAFLDFYVKEILSCLTHLDEDMVADGMEIDSAGDLGVDFIYKEGKTYYIFQSKFKGRKGSISSDEISGFFDVHAKITDKNFLVNYGNANLQDMLVGLTPNCEVQYKFVTNALFSDAHIALFKKKKDESEKKIKTSNISWEYVGRNELTNAYRRAQSVEDQIPERVEIPLQNTKDDFTGEKTRAILNLSSLVAEDNSYKTVVCPIKGIHIQQIYQEHKESLFSYNIRGFLGINAVNKKIKETIEQEPSIFYYLNNGISAICTDFNVMEKNNTPFLVCKDFQIINGAQTVTSIATHKNSEHLKKLQLLLRITQSSSHKSSKKGLNKKIITANNSQTVIRDSDFRSNDEVQTFLAKELKGYTYKYSHPYKVINYIPKRGGKKRRPKKDEYAINMEKLAKIIYSFKVDPILFQGKPRLLFDEDSENGKYWTIFGVDNEEVQYLAPEQVKEVAAIIMLWIYIEEQIKEIQYALRSENKRDSYRYQATLAKWLLVWSFGYALRAIDSDVNLIYKHIVDGRAFKHSGGFIKEWFGFFIDEIEDQIADEYSRFEETGGGQSNVPKSFNFRNWNRSNDTLKRLERKIQRTVSRDSFPKP